MRHKKFVFEFLTVITFFATLSTIGATSESNDSMNLNLGGSLTVSVRKEGEVSALVLFIGPGQEVMVNGEQSDASCIMMNNQREIDIRVKQAGNSPNHASNPEVNHNGDGSLPVVAQIEAKNCLEAQNLGYNRSGIYTLSPYDGCPERRVDILCDMELDGGGWTVIQNRDLYGPQGDFFRPWKDYIDGFGDLSGNFWLGVMHIYALTKQSNYEARLDLTDFEDRARFAKYGRFSVYKEEQRYGLVLDEYSGQEADAENCAIMWESSWWFQNCYVGRQVEEAETPKRRSRWFDVMWEYWRGERLPPKSSEIRIRPKPLENGGERLLNELKPHATN